VLGAPPQAAASTEDQPPVAHAAKAAAPAPSPSVSDRVASVDAKGKATSKSGAQRRAGKNSSRDNDDEFGKDWLLGDKDLDHKSHKILTVMLAQMVMAQGLAIKVLRSIGIDVENIPSNLAFIESSKSATKEYSTMASDVPAEKQSDLPPPYVLVWQALIDWALAQVADHPGKWLNLEAALQEYNGKFDSEMEILARMHLVSEMVRYTRIKTTYRPDRRILEVGTNLEPTAANLWIQIREGPLRAVGSLPKRGIAPKGGLERRVEKVLRRIKVWGREGQS
jgi:hypothetical protein